MFYLLCLDFSSVVLAIRQIEMSELTNLTHYPQESKPTASSKMMKSWLTSSASAKRKEPSTSECKDEQERKAQRKSTGELQRWLQGANKKPRTK